jgi:hypothetical protein
MPVSELRLLLGGNEMGGRGLTGLVGTLLASGCWERVRTFELDVHSNGIGIGQAAPVGGVGGLLGTEGRRWSRCGKSCAMSGTSVCRPVAAPRRGVGCPRSPTTTCCHKWRSRWRGAWAARRTRMPSGGLGPQHAARGVWAGGALHWMSVATTAPPRRATVCIGCSRTLPCRSCTPWEWAAAAGRGPSEAERRLQRADTRRHPGAGLRRGTGRAGVGATHVHGPECESHRRGGGPGRRAGGRRFAPEGATRRGHSAGP